MLAQLAFDAASNSSQSNCKRLCSYMLRFLSLQWWSILIILQLQVRNTEMLWSIVDSTWVPGTWTKAGEGETAQHHQKHYHHQMLCSISISLDSKSICIVSLSNGGGSALITSIVISSISAERNPDKIVVRLVSSAWNLLQGGCDSVHVFVVAPGKASQHNESSQHHYPSFIEIAGLKSKHHRGPSVSSSVSSS